MKIENITLLYTRHGPPVRPSASKGRKAKPPAPVRSILVEVRGRAGVAEFSGLGEIRASARRAGEGGAQAWAFGGQLALRLRGMELDENASGPAILERIGPLIEAETGALLDMTGMPLASDSHRATRFGFEAALLDLAARASGRALPALFGLERRALPLTVQSYSTSDLEGLISAFMLKRRPDQWVRLKGLANLESDLLAINLAGGGIRFAPGVGIWIDAGGTWTCGRLAHFLERVGQALEFSAGSVPLIIEEPTVAGRYEDMPTAVALLRRAREKSLAVSFMLSDSLWGRGSLAAFRDWLPYVDLAISPQRVGGVGAAFRMIEEARAGGFRGRVAFQSGGAMTDLNTIMLALITAATPEATLFEAAPARSGNHPLVTPQPYLSDERALVLPEGTGAGVDLFLPTIRDNVEAVQRASEHGLASGEGARAQFMAELVRNLAGRPDAARALVEPLASPGLPPRLVGAHAEAAAPQVV
jgi:L-alanine-DL-glutamate epimerase-like enolase superfamily enzyme